MVTGNVLQIDVPARVDDDAGEEVAEGDLVDAHRQRLDLRVDAAEVEGFPFEEIIGADLIDGGEVTYREVTLEAPFKAPLSS
jgi:hypothetical protein